MILDTLGITNYHNHNIVGKW